jgi:hypothetical protein
MGFTLGSPWAANHSAARGTSPGTLASHSDSSLERMADKPPEPKQTTPAGHRIRVPSREDFDRLVKKIAPPPRGRKPPAETDEPPERSER